MAKAENINDNGNQLAAGASVATAAWRRNGGELSLRKRRKPASKTSLELAAARKLAWHQQHRRKAASLKMAISKHRRRGVKSWHGVSIMKIIGEKQAYQYRGVIIISDGGSA
jgi:hypothetical protein